jgi:hypothetical protein
MPSSGCAAPALSRDKAQADELASSHFNGDHSRAAL